MTPWTVTYKTSPSMGFSRQVYWSGLPFPSPGDLPDTGIEPTSLISALVSRFFTTEPPGKPKTKNQQKVIYISMFGRFKNWVKTHILKRTCIISGSYRFLLAKVSKASNNSYRSLI